MPLFDDASPAQKQPPGAPKPVVAPVPTQVVAPAVSPAITPEQAAIRQFLKTVQRSAEDIGKIERMALGLLPPDREHIASYGRSPLDDTNRLSESVNALSIRQSQLGIDDFLAQVAKATQPASGRLLDRIARAIEEPLDLGRVDRRLSDLLTLLTTFQTDLQKLQPALSDAVARLDRHSMALAAVGAALQSNLAITHVISSRKSLLDAAASGANMSVVLYRTLDERAKNHTQALDQMRYVSLPNWRALHAIKKFTAD